MQGVYLHVLADSLGSLGVIISTLCVKYFNLVIADAICSLLISTTILLSGIPFLKMTVKQLVL
jgi:zinc transporter 5/7